MENLKQVLQMYLELLKSPSYDLNSFLNRKNLENKLLLLLNEQKDILINDPEKYEEIFLLINELIRINNFQKSPLYSILTELAKYSVIKQKANNELLTLLSKDINTEIELVETLNWNSVGAMEDKDGKLIAISLPKMELSEVPPILYKMPDLSLINLPFNKLKTLNSLGFFAKLKILNIAGNGFTKIPEIHNTEIQSLFMESNSLKIFNGTNISNKIKEIYLSSNKINTIENLEHLNDLKTLDLTDNDFTNISLPDNSLLSLKELNLSYNKLKKYSIQNESLEWVNLSSNKLKEIFPSLYECKNLKSIIHSENEITEIGASIEKLTELEEINLFKNNIETINENISKLTKLKSLKLGWNRLTQLPEGITCIKSLEYLNLTNNKLTYLPSNFSKLENLEVLYLSSNEFNHLPLVLGELPKIKEIHFMDNNITKITKEENDMLHSFREKGINFFPDYPEDLF